GHSQNVERNSSKLFARIADSQPSIGNGSSQTARRDNASGVSCRTGLMIGPRLVDSTSSTTGLDVPLIRISSFRTAQRSQRLPCRYSQIPPAFRSSSRNRSVLSVSPAVTPQAAKPLCPQGMAGEPTNDAPATAQSGVRIEAKYHGAGT